MFIGTKTTHEMVEISEFLMREREKAVSDAEWHFRMRGYGYNLRQVHDGIEVVRLPQNTILGTIHA